MPPRNEWRRHIPPPGMPVALGGRNVARLEAQLARAAGTALDGCEPHGMAECSHRIWPTGRCCPVDQWCGCSPPFFDCEFAHVLQSQRDTARHRDRDPGCQPSGRSRDPRRGLGHRPLCARQRVVTPLAAQPLCGRRPAGGRSRDAADGPAHGGGRGGRPGHPGNPVRY